jgi:hypothetical protein
MLLSTSSFHMKKQRMAAGLIVVCIIGVTGLLVELIWLSPLRTQIKALHIANYDTARRLNGIENIAAMAPVPMQIRLDEKPLRHLETCVEEQVKHVKADYAAIRQRFDVCAATVRDVFDRFRIALSEAEQFAVFVTFLTSRLADYGPSTTTDPAQIVRDPVLNCAQSMIFVSRTIKAHFPETEVKEVLVTNEAIGTHAFVEFNAMGQPMLLDGLIGLVALTPLDDVTAGSPPRPFPMIDLYSETNRNLRGLTEVFSRSMRLGQLSRADVTTKLVSK